MEATPSDPPKFPNTTPMLRAHVILGSFTAAVALPLILIARIQLRKQVWAVQVFTILSVLVVTGVGFLARYSAHVSFHGILSYGISLFIGCCLTWEFYNIDSRDRGLQVVTRQYSVVDGVSRLFRLLTIVSIVLLTAIDIVFGITLLCDHFSLTFSDSG